MCLTQSDSPPSKGVSTVVLIIDWASVLEDRAASLQVQNLDLDAESMYVTCQC